MSLPASIVLKSNVNNKYLFYGNGKETNRSFLRFTHEIKHPDLGAEFHDSSSEKKTDDEFFNLIKFEVEEAKAAEGFVHIRTCYNNKYWVRDSEEGIKIVAEANEPEEDQSKWYCTLFKPIIIGEADESSEFPHLDSAGKLIQLMHVSQLGKQYYLVGSDNTTRKLDDESDGDLVLANPDMIRSDSPVLRFIAFNVAATALLPDRMTFMGHDDKYITNFDERLLGFITSDVGNPGVAMWTNKMSIPRNVPIYVHGSNRKWKLEVPRESVGAFPASNSNTLFGAIKVGNHVALRCVDNGCFVHRTDAGKFHGLGCRISTITHHSRLRVGEPVISREILSAKYDLKNSRIYNTSNLVKYVDSRANNTSVEQTGVFQVEYRTSQTVTWNQSLTVQVGIKVSWSVGIPYVGDFGLDVSYDRTESMEWGEQKEQEEKVTYTHNVTIPPRKKVTLRVVATKSMCDVPFTCEVVDVMTDGTTRKYTKTDGLFTGGNEFQIKMVVDEEDL